MTQNHDTALYLDHNATTPPHPDVLAAMQQAAAQAWANPASVHRHGQRARAELDRCRAAVAQLFGTSARDVYLTSGGTEANNLALWHAFAPCFDEPGDDHDPGVLVLSRIEHPSVLQPALALARRGVALRWLEPSEGGRVAPEGTEACR